eukprot:scaffold48375_cov60-Cyclotella_meneghiniana.AAC.2
MQQDILKSLQTAQQVASLENRIDGILGPKGLTNSFEEQVNKHIEYARDEYLRQYEDSNNESKLYVTSMAQECDLAYNKIQREFESRRASLSAADTVLARIKPWLETMDMEDIQGVSTRVKAIEQDLKAIIGFIDYSPLQDGTTSKKQKKSKAVTMTMVHAAIKQHLRDTNMSTQTQMDTKLIESSIMASLQQQGIMSAKSTINMVNSAIKQFRENEIVSQIDPEFIESEVKRSLQEHGVISEKGNVYTKQQKEFLSMLESQREKFESIIKLLDSKYTNANSVHDDIMKLYEGVKKEITKYRSTPQTPASGFETNHVQPDQNEIENMVTKILTSQFQSQLDSQHDMLMASSQQALQMINDQMEECLSKVSTTTDSNAQPLTSEDTSNYIYGHVLRSDNSKSLSFTVEDRQRLCKSGWNIRRIFKNMTEAQAWSDDNVTDSIELAQENHNSVNTRTNDESNPSGGAQSNMLNTPSGGAQSNMSNTPGQANQLNETQHDRSHSDSNNQKQSNPNGDNPYSDEQDDVIAGWINIATGKRQLVCCKEDQQDVRGIQWRFKHRFNNRLAANAWLAAEELVPPIDRIQGWYNNHLDERYIVSCRDDLNQVFGKYWTRVCHFTTMYEATRWRDSHIPRDTSVPHPIDIIEDEISHDQERMKQSFHRDDYGYEYLKSRGDTSIREDDDNDWNTYTTGPWRREQALRNGFNRYDRKSTNEWVQSGRGREDRYGYSSPNERRTQNPYWNDDRHTAHPSYNRYDVHSQQHPNDHNSPHNQHGHYDRAQNYGPGGNNTSQHCHYDHAQNHGPGGNNNSPYSTPPRPALSPRTNLSFDTTNAHTYLMGDNGVNTLQYEHICDLKFTDPASSFEKLFPMHSKFVRNYEGQDRYLSFHRGPNASTIMSSSIHKSLTSTEQEDVIEWYSSLQQSLEPQGIPLIPFDDLEPKYGTVGFTIPGIGIIRYKEVGIVLGQLLAGKLLPMKSNADDSELSQLLSIDNVDRNKNGWDLLHTVFKVCVSIFNPDEPELHWPSYGASNNIFKFAERIMTVAKLARKSGQNCSEYKVTMKFLRGVREEAAEMYAFSAYGKIELLKQYPRDIPLPEEMQILVLAKSIHDANKSAGFDPVTSTPPTNPTKSLYRLATNNIGVKKSEGPSQSVYESNLNSTIQGVTRETITINAVYNPDNKQYTPRKKPIPRNNDGKRKRSTLYDPSIKCHACHQTGHPATRCHTLAAALWVQRYINNGNNKEICEKALKHWKARNDGLLKPSKEANQSSTATPNQILQTYCERYDFTVEKVDAQMDWAYFEDNEGETIADAFGVEIVEDSEFKES